MPSIILSQDRCSLQPTVSVRPFEMPAADLGPEDPLPRFRDTQQDVRLNIDPSLPEEYCTRIGWQAAVRVLPYRMQDGYSRVKRPRVFQSVVIENEKLRAIILPELGGRMASLYHKPTNTELLEPVRQFQPANLGLRNAWFSTGVEWNTPQFGHHYLTCAPMFAACVSGPSGEQFLRLYALERVKCFPYQIDFHLPAGSDFLYITTRVVNTNSNEIPMYWWTNIAVPQTPDRRVLAPADAAIYNCCVGGLGMTDVPHSLGFDMSYGTNSPFSHEFYFDIPPDRRPWIASIDGNGLGLIETSTAMLRGRKMFVFGSNQGGKRWQDYLNGPGRAYVEIQAGLTRCQLEAVPMPAASQWSWTEAIGLAKVDAANAHSENWDMAVYELEEWLDCNLPQDYFEELHGEFVRQLTCNPGEIICRGEGWGALEAKRTGVQSWLVSGIVFDVESLSEDQQPWVDLLETGKFPERAKECEPGHYMVQSGWQALLEESISRGKSDHWLAWYHLGVMRMESGDVDGAESAWQRSLAHVETSWALFGLSAIRKRMSDIDGALCYLKHAWEAGPSVLQIALEYGNLLLDQSRYVEIDELLSSLSPEHRAHERMRILRGVLALRTGRLDEVEEVLQGEFATIKEGEVTLTDLWFGLHERRLADAEGIPIDAELRRRVRESYPPPARIDFRMTRDVI